MIPPAFAERFLEGCTLAAAGILGLAFLFILLRLVRGPTLPDRIIALDMLTAASIGLIALVGIRSGNMIYVDVAIGLTLVGFLATVALARFLVAQGRDEDDAAQERESGVGEGGTAR